MPLVFSPSVVTTSTGVTLKAFDEDGGQFAVYVSVETWDKYGHAEVMLKANNKDLAGQREDDGSIVIEASDFECAAHG